MNILHYTLGLPPYRSGGLTKYATNLFSAQKNDGDQVFLLYAGSVNIFNSGKYIRQKKNWYDIPVYEINNSVAIPLLHGVKNPISLLGQTAKLSDKEMSDFYERTRPQIFHIHTLMGLPYELVTFLKNKGTKIVFTSHDYYGLCLKVNFINEKGVLCSNPNGANCALCNYYAPSNLFLRLRNSKSLLSIKNKLPQKKIKKFTATTSPLPNQVKPNISLAKEQEYELLIDYYKNIFALVDNFHFNSEVSKEVYTQHLNNIKSEVISISHNGIKDNRTIKLFEKKNVRLTFIGNADIYKGLPLLKNILIDLANQGVSNWTLNIWGGNVGEDNNYPNIRYRGKYLSNQLEEVFAETDLLIVPSLWKETFSLITLEALSFGVPVLVSSNVGAKDVVYQYDSKFVYETNDTDALKNILYSVLQYISLLEKYNKKIVDLPWVHSFKQHVDEIRNFYNRTIMKD